MGNLVRLCDYMLTANLAQHAVDASVALLSSLQPDSSSRVGCPALAQRILMLAKSSPAATFGKPSLDLRALFTFCQRWDLDPHSGFAKKRSRCSCHGAQGSFFNVRVSFSDEEGGISLRPDEFRVTEALVTNAVQGAVGLLSSLPRLSHTRSFVPFYEGRPSGTRLLEVVRFGALSP